MKWTRSVSRDAANADRERPDLASNDENPTDDDESRRVRTPR